MVEKNRNHNGSKGRQDGPYSQAPSKSTVRYHARMGEIRSYLGGKCVECGVTEGLQVDHINPQLKRFHIANNWGISWSRLVVELDKCQLLCAPHHHDKTLAELKIKYRHGTPSMYNKHGCRCGLCRLWKKNKNAKRYISL